MSAVRSQIEYFAALLGPPFETPQPLQPIAGPSRPQPAKEIVRKTSSTSLSIHAASRRVSTNPPPPVLADEQGGVPWYNVGDDVLEALQAELQRAMEERVSSCFSVVKDEH